jgi:hypothetical protein
MTTEEEAQPEGHSREQKLQKKVELSPSGEAIQRLEQFKIHPHQKVDILLVELGVKPATTLHINSRVWLPGEPVGTIDEVQFNRYMEAVRDAGLCIAVSAGRLVNPAQEVTSGTDGQVMMGSDRDWQALIQQGQQQIRRKLYIARSPEDLELVRLANERNDAKLYGQAYGFPATAVEAYARGEAISPDEIVGMSADVRAFAQYGFSGSDSSSDEIAVAHSWHDVVRAASPKIYQELIDLRE